MTLKLLEKLYGINEISFISNYRPFTEVDCDACVPEFVAKGGCECMIIGPLGGCDVSSRIPEGCYSCENKATEYCKSVTGKLL